MTDKYYLDDDKYVEVCCEQMYWDLWYGGYHIKELSDEWKDKYGLFVSLSNGSHRVYGCEHCLAITKIVVDKESQDEND